MDGVNEGVGSEGGVEQEDREGAGRKSKKRNKSDAGASEESMKQ